MIQWHRLFGLSLTDFFHDTSYKVEIEKDLSMKQQFPDVAVVEMKRDGAPGPEVLPDGLEELASHNLVAFKSHAQTLDHWAVEELAGHYANYRKQVSPSMNKLLPEEDFRLYAVCVRYPRLLSEQVEFRRVKDGVYDFEWGVRTIRTIVTGRVEKAARNLIWLLFSASPELVLFAARAYRWKIPASRVVKLVLEKYTKEEVFMTYTMEDFDREVKEYVLKSLAKEEIDNLLKGLSPEERSKGLGLEDRLKGLEPEDIEEYLRGLSIEERLEGMKPEVIEEYLRKLKEEGR